MITPLGPAWTSEDLTGSGQFVEIPAAGGGDPTIYVVSNALLSGSFSLLRSQDRGASFQVVATGNLGQATQFDPVITTDGSNLHILGTKADAGAFSLVKFTHALTDDSTTNPPVLVGTTLVTGSAIHSGYDMATLWDGSHLIVVGVLNLVSPSIQGYSLLALHVSSHDAVTSTDTLYTSVLRGGEVYGGICLATINGVSSSTVELYYTSHAKAYTYGSQVQELRFRQWSSSTTTWTAPTTLQSYIGSYVDDALSVLVLGDTRLIVWLSYLQTLGRLTSTLKLGSRVSGIWNWANYSGDPATSYLSPALSMNVGGAVYLAYLEGTPDSMSGGTFHVAQVDPYTLSLNQHYGNYNQLVFRWLRGSKSGLTSAAKWGALGEHQTTSGYTPVYLSELNLPPAVALQPASATLKRGIKQQLQAVAIDPDFDALGYSWSTTDARIQLQAIPGHPEQISLFAPLTVGPAEIEATISVAVQDFSTTNLPINPPVTASATVVIPADAAPVITWDSSEISVPRNSELALVPSISDAEGDALTYSWEQTTGPTLTLASLTTLPYLVVKTHGVSVMGADVRFTIGVSDGVNPTVYSSILLHIAPINYANLDAKFLSRSIYTHVSGTSPIRYRNNPDTLASWSSAEKGAISTEFFKTRNGQNTLTGNNRSVYIAPRSVVVLGPESDPGDFFYRKVFLPGNDRGTILDALQTEQEQTLVVTDDLLLLRYTPTNLGVYNLSDTFQSQLDLRNYLQGTQFKWFACNALHNGVRVAAFVTNKGVLMCEINEDLFTLSDAVWFSTYNGNLYGGDDVLFLSLSNVDSLHHGRALIGTCSTTSRLSAQMEYFETVYDLATRAVVNVWDRTNRINQQVYTGDLLDYSTSTYTGKLLPPVLGIGTQDATDALLSWQQVRSDLVKSYTLYVDETPGIPGTSVMDAPVINGFKAFPATVDYGDAVKVMWDCENALVIYVNGEKTAGNFAYITPAASGEITLIAINSWGESRKSLNLVVNEVAPRISSFTATGPATTGGPVTLAWVAAGADFLAIDHGIGEVTTRQAASFTPTESGTYTLYASNAYGVTTRTVTITL